MAHLLRDKSKVLVAFGACAYTGGIPGLANVANRETIFQRVYHDTPSTVNADGVRPQLSFQVPEGELTLPEFYDTVRTLAQVVPVEYFVPGCPPVKNQVEGVLQAVVEGRLPAPGSVVGASDKTVCDDCSRTREEKRVRRFYRPYEIVPDSSRCLLEQGIICAGPATRGGCGAPCLSANMPCRGCYGPPPNVVDQGGKLLSALASIIDSQDPAEIERVADSIPDLLGVCYLFGLPASLLCRVRQDQQALPASEVIEEAALAAGQGSRP